MNIIQLTGGAEKRDMNGTPREPSPRSPDATEEKNYRDQPIAPSQEGPHANALPSLQPVVGVRIQALPG